MRRFLQRLARDTRGAAAVEFAVWSSMFFMAALGGLDLADAHLKRSQMGEAISAAAMQSFTQRENVNFANLPGYVRTLSDMETAQVTISCNGVAGSCTNFNRTCSCLRQSGAFSSQACGTPCSGSGMTAGSNAGYYLTIAAAQNVTPVVLPGSLLGRRVSQSVTVRLQ